MEIDAVLILIGQQYAPDAIAQQVPVPVRREVFCGISSVSASEFFDAGRNGLRSVYRATMFAADYQGEELAELEKETYKIYRTYQKNPDEIELYLAREVGANSGNQN